MTTFREAVAAKTERLRREGRHFTPDTLDQRCADPMCRLKMPTALTDEGILAHPTCGPDVRDLVERDKVARR